MTNTSLVVVGIQRSRYGILKTYACIHTLLGHNNYVSALLVWGKNLISGSWDNTIQMWDIETRKPVATILRENTGGRQTGGHTNCVSALCLTENGLLISGSYDNSIKIWTPKLECKRALQGHSNWIYCLAAFGKKNIFWFT